VDPFATLGLPRRYEVDPQELETRYRDLQRALHPDRHANESPAQRRIALAKAVEVNEAYRALKDDLARGEALLALERGRGGGERSAETPEFLMEMMERREALGEARAARDAAKVRAMADEIVNVQGKARAQLVAAFAVGGEAGLAEAARLLGRLKYYRRFLDEVLAIEDEASAKDGEALG
jgi:molecular chaperone HscB